MIEREREREKDIRAGGQVVPAHIDQPRRAPARGKLGHFEHAHFLAPRVRPGREREVQVPVGLNTELVIGGQHPRVARQSCQVVVDDENLQEGTMMGLRCCTRSYVSRSGRDESSIKHSMLINGMRRRQW